MKTIITKMSIIGLIVIMMASCRKDPAMPGEIVKNIKTNEVTDVTAVSAVVSAYVDADCDERGVCWSESDSPTIGDFYVSNEKGKGDYTCLLTDLTPNKRYYCRAYGKCGTKYVYSQQTKRFTTKDGLPTIVTGIVSDITATSAKCGGEVIDDGGFALPVTARGVCWSTSQNPSVYDSHTTDGSGIGSFTSSITGLSENTTYYVRAYATNSEVTSYGEQKSFTTNGEIGGHYYVDIGLPSGTLWATCNVGADKPEDYGDYYQWGGVTPVTSTDIYVGWANCPGNEGNISYNADAFITWKATHLTDDVLNPDVDAAHSNWGGDWRMPTSAEWQELYDNTNRTWTTENGVYGWKFEGCNGNYVFLPAAGGRLGASLSNAGSHGYFWSSSLYSSSPINACIMYFDSGDVYPQNYGSRYRGFAVRPVRAAR